MDEEYKQSEISKEVQRLMDEEGYEFGEAVKEAMAQGYKDGGLMIAIQKLAQGGMTYGDKTYHQYHDQFVPPDTENMMYANGGGVGSMMQPKRGLVNEPGGYAGDEDLSIGDKIIRHGYFMQGPTEEENYEYYKDLAERRARAKEEFVEDDVFSIQDIFERDTPLTEGIFGLSEGFTLSPITILRRYLANKELEKKGDTADMNLDFNKGGRVPQLVSPSADGSRPGYRGAGGYQGGSGGGKGKGGGGGGPPGGGDRGMRSSPSSNTARERGIMSRNKGPKGTTGNIGGFKDSKGPDRSKVSQFSTYGRNKMNQNLTTNNPSRRSGILNAVKKNFNPLSLIAGAMFGPFAGLATRALTTPGLRTGITNAFSGLNEKMRGIKPLTGKANTQAEYEAARKDRQTQGRIDNMMDRMLAGKSFSQKNLDSLMGQMDRFGNPFGTNLGSIDNVRGPNSIRAQLNAPVVESIINEVIKAPPAKPNVTRDITYGDFPNAFNYLDVEDVDLYGTPKSTMPNYGSPAIMNPAPIERADPFSIDLSNAMADASTNTNQQILDNILNESIMKNQVQPFIDNQQKKNEELDKMRQELGLA